MDAFEFIRERQRMCRFYSHASDCYQCPAKDCECSALEDMVDDNSIVPIVEKWSAEHPRKTRQNTFLKQWPNALMEFGVLQICPRVVMGLNGWRKDGCGEVQCVTCRCEFWNQEVE